ncbi:MAG TPA: hypothetical protein PLT66_09155, partial [Bacillota bacterium]|nr:hypothetical protein [Bacillota bacterium]
GVLLVSRQGYTERGALEETVKAFQQVNARIIGHFFNDVNYEKYSYKYKYNTYNYHYKYKYTHDSDTIDIPKQ